MKYEVGDRVRIKSLDWYNRYTNGTEVDCGAYPFTSDMKEFCGQERIIANVCQECYFLLGIDDIFAWTDEMIECKVEEETKPKFKVGDILFYRGETCGYLKVEEIREENGEIRYYETSRNLYLIENDPDVFADKVCSVDKQNNLGEVNTLKAQSDNTETETHRGYYTTEVETTNESKKVAWFTFWDNDFADKVELDLSNRELIQEDGKWFVVKKKKGYPKTYEECLSVLGICNGLPDVEIYNAKPSDCKLFESLIRLKRCRDAYWKIYGEEFNWDNALYYIYTDEYGNVIESDDLKGRNCVLAFPDKASRDSFKENFDPDIEFCKEFL